MARSVNEADPYSSRLLKYIPSEIVAAYLVIQGMIPADGGALSFWVMLGVPLLMLALTPLYLRRLQGVKDANQIAVTMISFLVWLYTLGGPFTPPYLDIHVAWLGSIILVLWTLLAPLFLQGRPGLRVEPAAP